MQSCATLFLKSSLFLGVDELCVAANAIVGGSFQPLSEFALYARTGGTPKQKGIKKRVE